MASNYEIYDEFACKDALERFFKVPRVDDKGCSVHGFCIKGRMTKDEAHAMLAEKSAEQGDYQMVWIDSFPSNIGQGGYATLCDI